MVEKVIVVEVVVVAAIASWIQLPFVMVAYLDMQLQHRSPAEEV